MGPPLEQALVDISQKTVLPSQSLPSTATAALSTTSEPQKTQSDPSHCQPLDPQTRATPVVSIKPHCALRDYEIVANILSHLKDEPDVLAEALRTCSLFFQAEARILWKDAKPGDLSCIRVPRRRLEFANFLKDLTLWSSGRIRANEAIIDPTALRLNTLAVCNSGSKAFNSTLLMPYLSSTLQKLTADDRALTSRQRQYYLLDQHCLTHIPTTCHRLSVLDLDVVLDVTSCQLSQFFQNIPHLKSLRLGNYLETVLDHAVIGAVFTLPILERLELKPVISHQFAEELINTIEAQQILPSVRFMEIHVSEGDSSAPGNLLRTLTTLKDLTITVHNNNEWQLVLHQNLFEGISNLWSLRRLNIHLDLGVDMTDQGLAVLYPLENLTELGIWLLHGDGDTDQDSNNLHVSTSHFRDALYVLELIESASVDLVWTGILARDESKELHERGGAFSRYWTLQSNVVSGEKVELDDYYGDEEAGVDEVFEDFEASEVTPDDVWKGSSKAFSHDPVPWVDRDLNIFTNEQGHIIPIEEVVSDGSYNFFSCTEASTLLEN
ncbi:hypothetical protein KCU65_g5736, partial [Aureobasidium melanogenum]